MSANAWSRIAYGYALLLGLGLAYFLVLMPYQVSDNLEHLLILQFQPIDGLLVDRLTGPASVRPLMWMQQKVLFDLSPEGRYFTTYKVFHVLQLLAVVVLFIRLLRVRTPTDLSASALALTALVGIHTFNVTMREGYPVNHFMTVLVCCLVVVNLAMSHPGWWRDVVAVLVFAYAAFTFETGLLVWVCIVTAYAIGWRGVSGKGVAAATGMLALYFVVRYFVLDVGVRTLASMSSGYGFSVRNTDELERLFGDMPLMFYLYNIVSSAMTVLFSEPRSGVFQFTSFLVRGEVPPWSIVNVVTSVIGTTLIGIFVVRRAPYWRHRSFNHEDRLLLLFLAVLPANATMSYPYIKEVVMSPAGMFYAAALFVAVRHVVEKFSVYPSRVAAAGVAIVLLLLSGGWTLRTVTLVTSMRATAFVNRSDWAVADEHMNRNRPEWRGRHPDAERLFQSLREEVVRASVPQPYTMPRWTRDWFDPY